MAIKKWFVRSVAAESGLMPFILSGPMTTPAPPFDAGLMWFRRDLRSTDNAALCHALRRCRKVWCVFVFDRAILDELPRADRRVEFIHESLLDLDEQLRALGRANGVEGVA